jgi:hypothetical protein
VIQERCRCFVIPFIENLLNVLVQDMLWKVVPECVLDSQQFIQHALAQQGHQGVATRDGHRAIQAWWLLELVKGNDPAEQEHERAERLQQDLANYEQKFGNLG